MKRSKHSLSHYKLATFDMAELVPVACYEALPGDSIQQVTSALIRVSPLVAPVMHPVTVRLHHWFVPNRLLWDGWEDFITGGPDGIGGSSGAYPTIAIGSVTQGSLADYLGLPVATNQACSALPFRAYAAIFNEFYRDEDLVTKVGFSKASGADTTTNLLLQKIAWEKDMFSAARPWTQKGPTVSLPLGQTAPVKGIGVKTASFIADGTSYREAGGGTRAYAFGIGTSNVNVALEGTNASPGYPTIYADLSAATAASVNSIREAFALQRYQEARALYGSRYTEYLRYLGVRSSDARLQRPEYLGGGKQTIAFSEVLQTGPGTDAVGTMKGHGISAMRSRRFRRFFEEHGVVMTLMSVRPRAMYVNGRTRMWDRFTKEDYWQKELEQIGQQEVFNRELFVQGSAADGEIFGYNDRYYEYRHQPSQIAAEFRSTLNYWHLARTFASLPVLNASFVTCDPSKRIHAVQTNDVLWCMINHSIQARRMVGKKTVGRIM